MEYELDHEKLKIKEALRRLLRRETIDALGNGFFRMANKPKLIDKAKELCQKYHDKHSRYTLIHHLHQAAQLPK